MDGGLVQQAGATSDAEAAAAGADMSSAPLRDQPAGQEQVAQGRAQGRIQDTNSGEHQPQHTQQHTQQQDHAELSTSVESPSSSSSFVSSAAPASSSTSSSSAAGADSSQAKSSPSDHHTNSATASDHPTTPAPAAATTSPGWRVKLYQLNKDGQWDDHGTGQVSCRVFENSREAALVVISEDTEDGPVQQLFHGKVAIHNDIYQRQRDTIITWQQPDTMVDLALSFQDVEGCQDIWDALQNYQHQFNHGSVGGGVGSSDGEGCHGNGGGHGTGSPSTHESDMLDNGSSSAQGPLGGHHRLPPITEENFDRVAHIFEIVLSQPQSKPALARFLLEVDPAYVAGIISVFEVFQRRGDNDSMVLAFKVIWSIFRLNEPAIITRLLSDELYLRVANVIDTGLDVMQGMVSQQHEEGADAAIRRAQQQKQHQRQQPESNDVGMTDGSEVTGQGSSIGAASVSASASQGGSALSDIDSAAPMDIDDDDGDMDTPKEAAAATSADKSVQDGVTVTTLAAATGEIGAGIQTESEYQVGMASSKSNTAPSGLKNVSPAGTIEYGKGPLGAHLTGPQFKQVALISDARTLEKIHTNFRVLTLMDVVQGTDQMLDGALHQSFLSMVAQNSGDILRSLACDGSFLDGLFRAMNKGATKLGVSEAQAGVGDKATALPEEVSAKPKTRVDFLAATTRLDALRCLQEMCNQARQMQQRTSTMLYDAIVRFEWHDAVEERGNMSADAGADAHIGSGGSGGSSGSLNNTEIDGLNSSGGGSGDVNPGRGMSPDVSLSASASETVGRENDSGDITLNDTASVTTSSSPRSGASQGFLNREVGASTNTISGEMAAVSSQMVHETSVPTVFFGLMSSIMGDASASTKELLVATDLILSVVLHAPMLFQKFIIESGEHPLVSLTTLSGGMTRIAAGMTGQRHGNPHVFCDGKLLQRICARLIGDNEESVQLTCLEILKTVLDPTRMDDTKEEFLGIFYDHYIALIVDSLTRSPTAEDTEWKADSSLDDEFSFKYAIDHQRREAMRSSQVHVLDLLCFAVEHHTYRIKYYVLRQNVVGLAFGLLKCPQRYVQLAAIRFAATCIKRNENFYNRYIVQNDLLDPVFDVFMQNGARNNMINSIVLALIGSILSKNVTSLIKYIVEKHVVPRKLDSIGYVETFRKLMSSYNSLLAQAQNAQNARPLLPQNAEVHPNAARTAGSVIDMTAAGGSGTVGVVAASGSSRGVSKTESAAPTRSATDVHREGEFVEKSLGGAGDLASSLVMDLHGEKPSLLGSFDGLHKDESSLPLGHPQNLWDIDGVGMSMDMLNPDVSSMQAVDTSVHVVEDMSNAVGSNGGIKRPANAEEVDTLVKKAKLNDNSVAR